MSVALYLVGEPSISNPRFDVVLWYFYSQEDSRYIVWSFAIPVGHDGVAAREPLLGLHAPVTP